MSRLLTDNQVRERLAEDWGDGSPQFFACVKIFEYLRSRPIEQLKHLTLGGLKISINHDVLDTDLLLATQYLCGERVPVLALHFEFLDEDDNYHEISRGDMYFAEKYGRMVHPVSGEFIENYDENIFIYFTPGELICQGKS